MVVAVVRFNVFVLGGEGELGEFGCAVEFVGGWVIKCGRWRNGCRWKEGPTVLSADTMLPSVKVRRRKNGLWTSALPCKKGGYGASVADPL